jgi:septin family protein
MTNYSNKSYYKEYRSHKIDEYSSKGGHKYFEIRGITGTFMSCFDAERRIDRKLQERVRSRRG